MPIENPVAETVVSEGGSDFRLRVGDLRREGELLSVRFRFARISGGEGGYIGDVDLVAGGRVVDTYTQGRAFVPPSEIEQTLSGPIDGGETVTVDMVDFPGLQVTFTAPEPTAPPTEVACDYDGSKIEAGESVTIPATVTAGAGDTDASVAVRFEVAGATASETVTVSPGGSVSVEATFEISEPGEYQPTVTLE